MERTLQEWWKITFHWLNRETETKKRRGGAKADRLSETCWTSHLSSGRRRRWLRQIASHGAAASASKQRRTESLAHQRTYLGGFVNNSKAGWLNWYKGLSFKFPSPCLKSQGALGSPQSFRFETAINHSDWFVPSSHNWTAAAPPSVFLPDILVDETNFVISMN